MNTYYLVPAVEYNGKEKYFQPPKKMDEIVESLLSVTGNKSVLITLIN